PPAIVTVAALFCTPLQVMPFDGVIAQWSGTPSAASAAMQLQPGVQPPPAMSTPPATVNLPKLSIAEQLANAASKTRLEIARNGQPSHRRPNDRNDAGTLLWVTALEEEEHDRGDDGGGADRPQHVGGEREPLA